MRMRVGDSARCSSEYRYHDGYWQCPLLGNHTIEPAPFDVLHRQVGERGRLSDPVNRDDAGVIQRGSHLRLALEPADHRGTQQQFGRQHLERDRPPQLALDAAIDDGHPAAPDFPLDIIVVGQLTAHELKQGVARPS